MLLGYKDLGRRGRSRRRKSNGQLHLGNVSALLPYWNNAHCFLVVVQSVLQILPDELRHMLYSHLYVGIPIDSIQNPYRLERFGCIPNQLGS